MVQQRKRELRSNRHEVSDSKSHGERRAEHWMHNKWRPLMAMQYMLTCLCDFVLFPVLWSVLQAKDNGGVVTSQWVPITLQAGGFYHMSMGAIIGISAWGRTKEKTDPNMAFPQTNSYGNNSYSNNSSYGNSNSYGGNSSYSGNNNSSYSGYRPPQPTNYSSSSATSKAPSTNYVPPSDQPVL